MVASILIPGMRADEDICDHHSLLKSARLGRFLDANRREFVIPKRHGIKNHMRVGQFGRLKKKAAPSDVAAQPRGEVSHP